MTRLTDDAPQTRRDAFMLPREVRLEENMAAALEVQLDRTSTIAA
jgi:hypothetical protein